MSSKRKLEKKSNSTKKKRNTFNDIKNADSLDPNDVSLFGDKKISEPLPDLKNSPLPKFRRQIGGKKWAYGHHLLDLEKDKKNGKKHQLIQTHYVWDTTVKFPNSNLLSIWVFAIISVYDKDTNTFKRKDVTINIGKEFSDKFYNNYNFNQTTKGVETTQGVETTTIKEGSEIKFFDENDLINYIIQNPSMWF